MNTSVRTKFAALALALCANTALMGGVAVLFKAHSMTGPIALAATLVHTARVA